MGQKYIFSSRWEKNIVAILHFYGDRAIFLLLWDNQDTEPDLYEIETNISKQERHKEGAGILEVNIKLSSPVPFGELILNSDYIKNNFLWDRRSRSPTKTGRMPLEFGNTMVPGRSQEKTKQVDGGHHE